METMLAKAVGDNKSGELLAAAKQKSDGWLAATKETSESRLKMMREGIVPRIAVYAVLKENGYDPVPAFDDYVRNVAGPALHKT